MLDNLFIEKIICQVFSEDLSLTWDNSHDLPLENRFWLISSANEPRWLVPHNPKYGLSVLQQWRPYSTASYLKWQLLLMAYRAGKLHRLPGTIPVGIAAPTAKYWKCMGYPNEQHLVPTIYIGTPGVTRKAVVSLVNSETNEIASIAKYSLGRMAEKTILREADILTHFIAEKPGLSPHLLYVNEQTGISVQTALEGRHVSKPLAQAHIDLLSSLSRPGITLSLQQHVDQLNQRLQTLKDRVEVSARQMGEAVLKQIDDPTPLTATWIHGDFAPWNLKWVDRQRLVAVDWEDARPDGLPLYDLFHYQYIQSHLLRARKNILDLTWKHPVVSRYLGFLGIDRLQYNRLALYYLTDMWIKSLERNKTADGNFFKQEISYTLQGVL
ncbi:phosphotransferase [Acaryochloris sp. IP29b_bin.148]|uniref:phosphotransferase family protein n=1 Tax=Acaryochloris sp. IP29b_bin.148 TaxID=2969218 RepID=UPI00262DA691|nr:phosphotransferase [Acaryochloris sp. IP29b_bin.148]